MPSAPSRIQLPLRWDGDDLVLSFGADSPFGAAVLSFPGGGLLTVDPAAPGRLLYVTTPDPDAARTTLTQLLGAAAMTALTDIHFYGADMPDTRDRRLVPVVPTDAAAPLARLALVSWVADWAPLDVPRLALLADLGDAAHGAGNPGLAYDAFRECAWFLLELSRAAQARSTTGPLASALAQVLRSAADVLGVAHGQHTQLTAAAATLAVAGSAPPVPASAADAAAADPSPAAQPGRWAGQPSPETGAPFPLEWAQVPAGVFDPAEEAGTVTRSASEVRVSVRPARWLDASQARGLRARLIDADTGDVLASAPLVFDQALQRFITEFRYDQWADQVDPAALHDAVPDIYSDVWDTPPLDQTQKQKAHAHRCAVRALTAHRLARASVSALGQAAADAEADAEAAAAIEGFASLDSAAAAALEQWQRARRGPTAGPGDPTQSSWPSGLPLPGADQVDQPLLSELLATTSPPLWPDPAPSEAHVGPLGEPRADSVVLGSSPFGAAVAPLGSVGHIEVDPAAPARVLSVSSSSRTAVTEVIARALGGDTTRRIVERGLQPPAGDDVGDVVMAPPPMGRLALASWWDAQPLADAPAGATALDVALAAHQAGRQELAASLFQRWADFARTLASHVADRALPAPLVAEVRTTLLAAAEQLSETALADDLLRTADVLATPQVSAADLALLWDAVGSRERRSIAGAQHGVFSVDWDHVRARTVSAEEGAVTASALASGIEVRAVAHRFRDVTASRDLAVRLVDSANGVVVATAPLRWSSEADCFVARFEPSAPGSIDQYDLSRVFPDVYSAQIPSATRVGTQADEAQARRTAVRALVLTRRSAATRLLFGHVDPDLASRVRRLVTRAERGFRHAGNDEAADQIVAWHVTSTSEQHTGGADAPLLSEMLAIAAPDLLDVDQARRS